MNRLEKRFLFVGFSVPKGDFKFGSSIIRWFEAEHRTILDPKSWNDFFFASHVFNIFPKNLRRPFYMVSEAAGSYLRFMSQKNFEEHVEVVALYRFDFDQLTYDKVLTYAEQEAGTPYAFMENIGIGLVRIWNWLTGKRLKNPFATGEKAQKCSELVLRNVVLRLEGVTLKELCVSIFNETGEYIPPDFDLIGVRDIYYILEYLANTNRCIRLHDNEELKQVA